MTVDDFFDFEHCFIERDHVNIILGCDPETLGIEEDANHCDYVDHYLRINPFTKDIHIVCDFVTNPEYRLVQCEEKEIPLSEHDKKVLMEVGESCVRDRDGWDVIFSNDNIEMLKSMNEKELTLAGVIREKYWRERLEKNGYA